MAQIGSVRVFSDDVHADKMDKTVLSLELRSNSELCMRVYNDLNAAIPRIRDLLTQISSIKINRNLESTLSSLKWRICKYDILQSDCSWQEKDMELCNAITGLDMCYKMLTLKHEMELRDVFHMRDSLTRLLNVFEEKIEQIQEVLTV